MTTFIREDWTLFRTLGTLSQKAGVAVPAIPQLVAKELADNALDVAGNVQVVMLEGKNGFCISDQGDGIPGDDNDIARLFSVARPLVSSKLLRLPMRGALGNGLRVVAGAVLATGGELIVSTCGRRLALYPQDDGTTRAQVVGDFGDIGTRVEIVFGDALPVDITALDWAESAMQLATGDSYKGKTSPFWYDTDAFFELFQAAGERPVRELIAEFDGCSGAKAGKIAATFLGRGCSSLTREESEALLESARTLAKPVKAVRLGIVGAAKDLPDAYAKVEGAVELKAARGSLNAVIPFVVEAWIDLGDNDGKIDIMIAVNKTPITAEVTARTEKAQLAIIGAGLKHYVAKIGRAKVARVIVNVITPYMPITSDGKAPDLRAMFTCIGEAIETATRRAKRGNRANAPRRHSQKDIVYNHLASAVNKTSQSGRYRFSQRQLFYSLRPYLIEATGQEPEYDTVARILTDYENDFGDIRGMYRDTRGTLYHPHTGEDIPLGTLEVERYSRPEWTFNKILYIEKEGFFGILKAERWPERHDCALLTSKGQATRAAKDLLDLLGETEEEITFYCVHDADAYGTLIYQALQDGTRTRPGRKVKIVNFGLDPVEGIEMGLQVERVASDKKRHPVGTYVDPRWAQWLQTHRIELNAMTTDLFLRWLDYKMEIHGSGKLIPPQGVAALELVSKVLDELRRQLSDRILADARINDQVSSAFGELYNNGLQGDLSNVLDRIDQDLSDDDTKSWRKSVVDMAGEVATSHLAGN
ncbi:MAG: hypothetical protein IT328_27890 [Caldilineaceae bacterium]|nr:hypothetical protein [Caldilineaceae bacterium]